MKSKIRKWKQWRKQNSAKAVRAIVGFFVIALIFTYISRFATAAITPKVVCSIAQSGTVMHEKTSADGTQVLEEQSQVYDYCLPWSGIRSGSDGSNYVLIVEKKESILGEVLYAKKAAIKIKDGDNENCAFESSILSTDSQVIIESDKNIEAGDTVRLADD